MQRRGMLPMRTRAWWVLAAAWLALVTAGTGTAWAHAEVVATYPSGETSPDRLTHVSVTFDEAVELIPRSLVLTTDLGVPVALDPPRLAGGRELRAGLQDAVAPGRYSVGWRVRTDDGHIESGTFDFRVAATGPDAAAPAAMPPASAPAAAPMSSDEPRWPVLVAAGLAVVAGLGAALVVRRGLRALDAPDGLYPADHITAASRGEHSASQE